MRLVMYATYYGFGELPGLLYFGGHAHAYLSGEFTRNLGRLEVFGWLTSIYWSYRSGRGTLFVQKNKSKQIDRRGL